MRELKTGQYEMRPLHEFTVTKTDHKKPVELEPIYDYSDVRLFATPLYFKYKTMSATIPVTGALSVHSD